MKPFLFKSYIEKATRNTFGIYLNLLLRQIQNSSSQIQIFIPSTRQLSPPVWQIWLLTCFRITFAIRKTTMHRKMSENCCLIEKQRLPLTLFECTKTYLAVTPQNLHFSFSSRLFNTFCFSLLIGLKCASTLTNSRKLIFWSGSSLENFKKLESNI